MSAVPKEVRSRIDWGSIETIPDDRIRFAAKKDRPRGDAWRECPMPPKTKGERPRNPWRKAHTENYWAWYCLEEVPNGREETRVQPVCEEEG